jgi:transposase
MKVGNMQDRKFKECNRDQLYLLPPSLRDWLPANHLAHFIVEVVFSFDFSAIYNSFKSQFGPPAFQPEYMVAIWLYAYCAGVRSSRRVAKALQEDVGFRVVSGNQQPDFRTLSEFRRKHHHILAGLFFETVKLAKEAGLVKLGHVAIDGTKVKANASKHSAMSYQRMKEEEKRLEAEIEQWMREADETDAQEDKLHGDKSGWELPEHFATAERRLENIRNAKTRLEERAKQEAAKEDDDDHRNGSKTKAKVIEPQPKEQSNFTDPESQIMLNSDKAWVQAYNAQAAVDAETQIIVAAELTNQPADSLHLPELVKQTIKNTGETPREVSADAAYCSQANLELLDSYMIEPFIPPEKIKHSQWRDSKPILGRPPDNLSAREKMKRKLRTRRGKERYKLRQQSIEPVFGQIKEARGLRQFLHRGLEKTRSMWLFDCAAHNILKLFRARTKLMATT